MTQTKEDHRQTQREILDDTMEVARELGLSLEMAFQLKILASLGGLQSILDRNRPDPEYTAQLKEMMALQLKALKQTDEGDRPWDGTA